MWPEGFGGHFTEVWLRHDLPGGHGAINQGPVAYQAAPLAVTGPPRGIGSRLARLTGAQTQGGKLLPQGQP